ncbi:unnamed protein product [Pieris brassicae]|uniref:ZAD domain-containing protein n=1 Tax=Pieris brassicae TaxID=7116 RepID=A0A9P0T964_PIEBR|nr:unnamed protein product [Pieris brassicae]
MIDKILVCLKIVIEKTDRQNTICYKCAENVERFYDFITTVKKWQCVFDKQEHFSRRPTSINTHITSYIREEVVDADCTFSCMELRRNNENKETKQSSPFFSYFAPPPPFQRAYENSRTRSQNIQIEDCLKRKPEKPKQLSGDIFESQPDFEELDRSQWKLSHDQSLMKKIKEKCFGRSEY